MRSLDQLFLWAQRRAAEVFDNSGFHAPLFAIELPGGEVALIITPWPTDKDKEASISAVRKACVEKQAQRVVIVHEGWMREEGTNIRTEVLLITGQSCIKGERQRAGYYEIVRRSPSDAKVGRFVELDRPGISQISIFDGLTNGHTLH